MSRGVRKMVTDMDDMQKLKGEIKDLIRTSLETLASKQDREISLYIKRQCDEKYGPTWQCIVGEDFKASFTHQTKHFMFIASGKQNVCVLWAPSPIPAAARSGHASPRLVFPAL
jgi:hypothetical protein